MVLISLKKLLKDVYILILNQQKLKLLKTKILNAKTFRFEDSSDAKRRAQLASENARLPRSS